MCLRRRVAFAINFDPRGARALGFVLLLCHKVGYARAKNKRRRDTALTPDDRTGQRHRHMVRVSGLRCTRSAPSHKPTYRTHIARIAWEWDPGYTHVRLVCRLASVARNLCDLRSRIAIG